MPVDIDDIFTQGDKELIDLLNYAVRAVQIDVLFIFLVREYREHPTTPKAVALYDSFLAPQALARLGAPKAQAPLDIHVEAAIAPLRLNLAQVLAVRPGGTVAPPLILPPKFLFDEIVLSLRKTSSSLRAMIRRYRPSRSPVENMPGMKMNVGQRHFVDNVWGPNLRPRLIAAGFRRLTAIA